jgi:hypothetical protein
MTITKLNSRAGLRGIQALVVVDRGDLASLLGDSEGPAHEDWDTSEDRPNRTWMKWKGRVKFCRRVIDDLADLLAPPAATADFDLLSDVFSIEQSQAPQRSSAPRENGDGRTKFGDIKVKPVWYRLDGRRGGFRVVASGKVPIPPGAQLRVSVAYDLPSGNPLKKWSPFDFELRTECGIKMDGEHVDVKRKAGNVLLLQNIGERFEFSAEGFDEYRDLLVRIDEFADAEPEEEDEQ